MHEEVSSLEDPVYIIDGSRLCMVPRQERVGPFSVLGASLEL